MAPAFSEVFKSTARKTRGRNKSPRKIAHLVTAVLPKYLVRSLKLGDRDTLTVVRRGPAGFRHA